MNAQHDPTGGTLGVIGLGQIGGSLARALLQRGRPVLGLDADAATGRAARDAGVQVADDLGALLAGADAVVLAVPLDRYVEVADGIAAAAGPRRARLLLDVGSSSRALQAVRAPIEAAGLTVIGSHPMAGTERRGWPAADADLFAGCTWAVLHAPGLPAIALLHVARFVIGLGASALVVDAAAHDDAVARISHAPHLLAMAIVEAALARPGAGLAASVAAGSFRDGTRVVTSPPDLVTAMCHHNAAALTAALDDALAWLARARAAVGDASPAALRALVEAAHATKLRQLADAEAPLQQTVTAPDADALLAILLQRGREGVRITALQMPPDSQPAGPWSARLLSTPASTTR